MDEETAKIAHDAHELQLELKLYSEPRIGRTYHSIVEMCDHSGIERRILELYPHQRALYNYLLDPKAYKAVVIDSLTDMWSYMFASFKHKPRNKGQRKHRAKKGWRRYS